MSITITLEFEESDRDGAFNRVLAKIPRELRQYVITGSARNNNELIEGAEVHENGCLYIVPWPDEAIPKEVSGDITSELSYIEILQTSTIAPKNQDEANKLRAWLDRLYPTQS